MLEKILDQIKEAYTCGTDKERSIIFLTGYITAVYDSGDIDEVTEEILKDLIYQVF